MKVQNISKESKPRVLIVDDEETICRSVEKILARMGHAAEWTLSPLDALDRLEDSDNINLLIADLMMPELNGIELLKIVRDRWPDVAVLMITGYASIPSAIEATRKGALGYLPKPFTPNELENVIRTVLMQRPRAEEALSENIEDDGSLIDVDMPFDEHEVADMTSRTYVDHLTRSDVPRVDHAKPSKMYCSLGQRDCKRFESKGMCKTEECPILVAERKKTARDASIAGMITDPIDVDMPFSESEVASYTSEAYVNALGRSEIPVTGRWKPEIERVKSRRILVVDDEPVVVNSIIKSLKNKGYLLDEAFTGNEAITRIREQNYDLILLDMKLPDSNGLDLIAKIKTIRPGIPVVIVTGYASIDTAVEAISRGANDYLAKPFTPDELSSMTNRVLQEYVA